MARLTEKQKKEIVSILKHALGNTDRERAAFLAFTLSNSNVLDRINFSGDSFTFFSHLIETLNNFGEIEEGKEALWAVLEGAREAVGVDHQARIDALRPIFEKPSVQPILTVEPEPPKREQRSEGKPRLNTPTPGRPSRQELSIEAPRPQTIQKLPAEKPPAEKRLTPVETAREYVESMVPVPPDHPGFYMAPCLVSNELYYQFVCANSEWLLARSDADSNYLKHWVEGEPRAEDLRLPVTSISFRAAKAFAEWLSQLSARKVRIPKLEEWQVAASAGRGAWLEEAIAARRVNYFDTSRHLRPVDAFKPNPYGIRDLIGQAFDMCFKGGDSLMPTLVGGCYHSTVDQLRASLRGEEVESDKVCSPYSSFRCVRSD